MDIFIARQGQTFGPFDLAAVNARLLAGEFSASDQCWSEAQPVWQSLSLLDGVQLPAPRPGQMPPPPPYIPPAPTPPYPLQSPYPGQPIHPGQSAPSGDYEEERVLFHVSASPLAMSLKDLVLGILTMGAWLVYIVARNTTTRYKLTNQRLTLRSGLLSQSVEEIEIYRVRDVTVQQGAGGLLLGFGDVVVHASDASTPRLVLRHAPAPNRLKEQIRAASRQGRRSEGVRSTEYMG